MNGGDRDKDNDTGPTLEKVQYIGSNGKERRRDSGKGKYVDL
jgi:hypothetical protein